MTLMQPEHFRMKNDPSDPGKMWTRWICPIHGLMSYVELELPETLECYRCKQDAQDAKDLS